MEKALNKQVIPDIRSRSFYINSNTNHLSDTNHLPLDSMILNTSKVNYQYQPPETFSDSKYARIIKDTFTFPDHDYGLIDACRQRSFKEGYNINKSEVIRAGLLLLSKLSKDELMTALTRVKKIKTGRPKLKSE